MYQTAAFLYEATAAQEVPQHTCTEILRILERSGLKTSESQPGLIGDLGAGTGIFSVLLAEQGWTVYGVELSPDMLALAEAKREHLPEEIQTRITWTLGDITQFALPNGLLLDGAICLHNTINHLSEWSQVEGFIQATWQALKPGGVLIFDSDTQATFQHFFHHEPTVVWDDGQHRLVRACQFNPKTGRAEHMATVFQAGQTDWTLLGKETIALQYHPEPKLHAAFTAAGFQCLHAEAHNPNPDLYTGESLPADFIPKVLWAFQKPVEATPKCV